MQEVAAAGDSGGSSEVQPLLSRQAPEGELTTSSPNAAQSPDHPLSTNGEQSQAHGSQPPQQQVLESIPGAPPPAAGPAEAPAAQAAERADETSTASTRTVAGMTWSLQGLVSWCVASGIHSPGWRRGAAHSSAGKQPPGPAPGPRMHAWAPRAAPACMHKSFRLHCCCSCGALSRAARTMTLRRGRCCWQTPKASGTASTACCGCGCWCRLAPSYGAATWTSSHHR